VRTIDNAKIRSAGATRFRSEYHYALFEFHRSAKVIAALERAGVQLKGRVLDAGCGGGGTVVSLGQESSFAVGLDIKDRFRDAGTRLATEEGVTNVGFLQGDAGRLPFRDQTFDFVFSHSVIEHVESAERYLSDCHRVLVPGGILYLSTAPYLSLAGSHFPRLRFPLPLHLLFGRRIAFWAFRMLARYAPWTLAETKEGTSFITLARRGERKKDDLLQRITVRRLRSWIEPSGFRLLREERHVTGFFKMALPAALRTRLEATPWTQDVMIGHIECVLVKS
jgi:ubiquinone/menaquinone biosynthesis C-methylase UbiE